MPSIALAIPAYNVESEIGSLIDSARKQSVPFSEVLVYDDCSSDNTAIVAEAARAHVIRGTTNAGPAFARNRLLYHAKSSYIHFHDADDPFLSDEFVNRVSALVAPKTAAFCSWWRVDEEGEQRAFDNHFYGSVTDWPAFFLMQHVHLNACIYPTRFLQEQGGFCEQLRGPEDLFLNVSMASRGLQFRFVDEILAVHQRVGGSLTNAMDSRSVFSYVLNYCRLCSLDPKIPKDNLGERIFFHMVQCQQAGLFRMAGRFSALLKEAGLNYARRGRLSGSFTPLIESYIVARRTRRPHEK
jgi:glycosyltransferase involved in cell wall biosynthesis